MEFVFNHPFITWFIVGTIVCAGLFAFYFIVYDDYKDRDEVKGVISEIKDANIACQVQYGFAYPFLMTLICAISITAWPLLIYVVLIKKD